MAERTRADVEKSVIFRTWTLNALTAAFVTVAFIFSPLQVSFSVFCATGDMASSHLRMLASKFKIRKWTEFQLQLQLRTSQARAPVGPLATAWKDFSGRVSRTGVSSQEPLSHMLMSSVKDVSWAGGVQSEKNSSEWYGLRGNTLGAATVTHKCQGCKEGDLVKKRLFTDYLGSPG